MLKGAYLNRILHEYISKTDGDVYYLYEGHKGSDGLHHISSCLQYHLPNECIIQLNGVRITMPPDTYVDVDCSYQSIDFSEWNSDTIVHIPFNKLYSFEIIK